MRGMVDSMARWGLLLLGLGLLGCGSGFGPLALRTSDYEKYADSIRGAGLAESTLGRQWLEANLEALLKPEQATPPLREELFFSPERPEAFAWRFELRRGHLLRAVISPPPETAVRVGRLFLDLFRIEPATGDAAAEQRFVAELGEGGVLEHEIDDDGTFVLRLQGELLAAGRVLLEVTAGGRLTFPVEGADARAIGSRFGDPRNGGRRSHEGVDIFAPRGTPALAAVDGVVTGSGENRLGGRVIWLRGEGVSLYYAHLDEQLTSFGSWVAEGELVGQVGNTGNARSTPPHLHFGLFESGRAVDPEPYLASPGTPPEITADRGRLGGWARVRVAGARLRGGPSTSFPILDQLSRNTALRPVAAAAGWYRVRLGEGGEGYIASRLVEDVDRPIRGLRIAATLLRHRPSKLAPAIERLNRGDAVEWLAESGEFLLVRTGRGTLGWLAREAAL